ncbi:RNA dependent RNA polymerase-domain-containing protein [Mycena rosella]|uniref:RNA-dependent RNA polymerase n=1 Tax=Mycena rosella TaxID=1033263 RepID=A0AAD7DPT9_MYCRO|nr:RNA dependent RNA polymerase-domain-containing protein [Mycena rosella]
MSSTSKLNTRLQMTPSQAAYTQLDISYPPEFWDEVLETLDGEKLTLTQGSSGSETVINSATVSLSDISDAGGAEQGVIITASTHLPRMPVSPSKPVGVLQINQSPSRSPRSKPSMAPPRAIPSAGSCGDLFSGAGVKRSSSETALPPAKIRKVSVPTGRARPGVPSRSTAPSRMIAVPPQESFSLQYVFKGHHGLHLQSYVVAHSADVQPKLDRLKIARGVQWELVRGIQSGLWSWADVKAKLGNLQGANADVAPRVNAIMLGGPSNPCSPHEQSIWEELDRELKATVENKSRGLGLMGEFDGVPDYYGGNVQFTIRLLDAGEGKEPRVRLEPLQMTRSHHLARELGSVSVIALRDDKDGALVRQWAARKFVFCGRTYVALPPKSSKVYLIETDENCGRTPQECYGDQYRISYDAYIRRNNPMDLNSEQPFAKYLTRLNLYLSTSVPALEFTGENIEFIEDEYADGWSKDQKPPTETIMTDGCGFINRAAALKISARLKYERPPVAYQGRIAGSKGMWIIHPSDESPEPRIWIRSSQRKIVLGRLLRAHRIFDLLAVSRPSPSLHLSAQAIVILANNGVPAQVFCALQEQGLKDLIAPLLDWHRPHATAYLWDAINVTGNVKRSRLQRLAAGASRALGFEKRAKFGDDDKMEESNGDLDSDLRDLPHTGRCAFSGVPLSVAELAMDLLQAGFDPRELPLLGTKIGYFVKATMEAFLAKYRIPLATSLEAYIIPDPSGKLKEGQVFFKSSRDPDGPLKEEVVVGRYPMRESSDMQKVTAVDVPELAKYVDVLVISIRGTRSLASLLAGGDTDGDEAIIIREPAIVNTFQTKPFVPPPAEFLAQNFERQVQSVADFGRKLEGMPIAQAQTAFQTEVSGGLGDNRIGTYSIYHDCAMYYYGLDHPETRRLAHMVVTLVDVSKTGLRLLEPVAETDRKYGANRPRCLYPTWDQTTARPKELELFVLDSLLEAGAVTKDELIVELDAVCKIPHSVDLDIREPYARALAILEEPRLFASSIAQELDTLKAHVEELWERFKQQHGKSQYDQNPDRNRDKKGKGPSKQTDNPMLPIMRDFRQPLEGVDFLRLLGNVDSIKASYAFTLAHSFAFSMAFQDICEMKRRAEMRRGPQNKVAVIEDAKNMGGAARRLFLQMGDRE